MIKHKILSLFANIGVAEAYLEELGHDVIVANELDPKRATLYQKIYPKTKMVCGDITDDSTFYQIMDIAREGGVNCIVATPPCQGMSTAGRQKKFDVRNDLFRYALNAVNELKPEYVLFENVTGFLKTHVMYANEPMLITDVVIKEIGDEYIVNFYSINAQDYEVPQTRERMIMLATRKKRDKKHPEWVMPKKCDKIVTMKDAIGWIPIIDPFVKDLSPEEFAKLFPKYEERKKAALKISKWNFPTSHVYRNVLAMQHTPTGCTAFDNPIYKPTKKDGTPVRGFHNTYKRQNWDTPAYTIAMDNIEISSQNNVHPGRLVGKDENGDDIYSDARALTVFELMRLMSIPDTWPIPDGTNPAFLRHMIGEGVPSLLIKKIFENLKDE